MYPIITKFCQNEVLMRTLFWQSFAMIDWVKIVDFLIKAYFWLSINSPGTHCIFFWNIDYLFYYQIKGRGFFIKTQNYKEFLQFCMFICYWKDVEIWNALALFVNNKIFKNMVYHWRGFLLQTKMPWQQRLRDFFFRSNFLLTVIKM